jgi:branched-chain amino acid aminotransferase
MTGTGAEIIPVIKIDGRMIGDGTPGFVTERLILGFKKLVSWD